MTIDIPTPAVYPANLYPRTVSAKTSTQNGERCKASAVRPLELAAQYLAGNSKMCLPATFHKNVIPANPTVLRIQSKIALEPVTEFADLHLLVSSDRIDRIQVDISSLTDATGQSVVFSVPANETAIALYTVRIRVCASTVGAAQAPATELIIAEISRIGAGLNAWLWGWVIEILPVGSIQV